MSYYSPPPSSPFAGANFSPRPEYYQRPPSRPTVPEQVLNSPDVYSAIPVALPLTPSANLKGPVFPPPATQVPKSPKTYLQWKVDAKASTADYQLNGFPAPVAWVTASSITPRLLLVHGFVIQVYVEGHAVPPNAIIGGVDRKGPWYIARSFYEV